LRKISEAVETTKGGCYLNAELSPGAKKSEIMGIDAWRGTIRFNIAEQPISGKANLELIQLLESIFPEAKGKMKLVKGEKSRRKRIFIPLREEIVKRGLGTDNDL